MGLIDSAIGSLGSLANNAVSGVTDILAANGADTARFYKVYVLAEREGGEPIRIVADCPQEFTFSTAVNYDAPFQDMLSSKVDSVAAGAAQALGAFGVRLFNQAMTCKVWTGASDTVINLPFIFQVENSADVDVLLPIMQLMFLSMPGEKQRGDFLTAPGPSFDWKKVATQVGTYQQQLTKYLSNIKSSSVASSLANVGASSLSGAGAVFTDPSGVVGGLTNGANAVSGAVNSALMGAISGRISLQIGGNLFLKDVVIENVSQTQVMSPVGDLGYGKSSGINSLVRVDVTFRTFYTLTQQDLYEMLLPIQSSGAPTTRGKLEQLLSINQPNTSSSFMRSEKAYANTVNSVGPPTETSVGEFTLSGG